MFKTASREIKKVRRTGATRLDLSGLELKEIPEAIATLPNLQSLNLSGNHLFNIPKGLLNRLPRLNVVNLCDNQFTHIPESLGEIAGLEMLFLGANRIGDTPQSSLVNLKNLEHLHLSYNRFTRVPDWMGRLPKLTNLNMARNYIDSIDPPAWASDRPHLKLDISFQYDPSEPY